MFQKFLSAVIVATIVFSTLAFSQGVKKTVAVLQTSLMEDNVKLSAGEQKVLTDRLQEKAVEALGGNSGFVIMTRESIMSRIGTDNYVKVCQASSCIVVKGKRTEDMFRKIPGAGNRASGGGFAGGISGVDVGGGGAGGSVKIGSQVWAKRNSGINVSGSKCYNNDPENCKKYGRLYTWKQAKQACPTGWHLPSDAEWTKLTDYAGGSSTAGKKLKAKSGWYNNGNCTDGYGFSALPGGYGYSGGSFSGVGYDGYWWSATEYGAGGAYYRGMFYGSEGVDRDYHDWDFLFSVRCLRD